MSKVPTYVLNKDSILQCLEMEWIIQKKGAITKSCEEPVSARDHRVNSFKINTSIFDICLINTSDSYD